VALTIVEGLEAAAVIDSLLRNENPLNNASAWHKPSWCVSIQKTSVAQGWEVGSTFVTGADGARFDDISFLQKLEGKKYTYTIGTVTLDGNQTPERWYALWLLQHASAQSGYRFRPEVTGTDLYKLWLERANAGSYSALDSLSGYSLESSTGQTVATFAIVAGEGNVYGFLKKPAGGSVYEEVLQAADSTYTEGYAGMEGRGNFANFRNFRVGNFILEDSSVTVNVKVGGVLVPAKRWVKTPGGLVNV
jgi:hypothetical protein